MRDSVDAGRAGDTVPFALVVLAAVAYVVLCVGALLFLSVPAALVLGPAAALIGALGTWALLAGSFATAARNGEWDLPAPDGVAAHVLNDEPRPVEPAWQHYLAVQWRLDLEEAYDRVLGTVAKVWQALDTRTRDAMSTELWPLLWPFAPLPYVVGAAVVVGAAAAGAVASVLVAVPAGLFWLVRAGAARFLVRRERRRLHRLRAVATCTAAGCDDVTEMPVVACGCGRRHYRLEPGRFGVLRRRCTCGALLPTTISGAVPELRLYCPRCDRPLQAGAMIGTDVRVAVLGPPGSGRSSVVRGGLAALCAAVREAGGTADVLKPATTDGAMAHRVCTSVRLTAGSRSGTVHVHDPAGAALDEAPLRRHLHHLRAASAFALVVDVTALPRPASTIGDGRRAVVDPEPTYRAVVGHLLDVGADLARLPLAVVLTRADVLEERLRGRGPRPGSAGIRQWLAAVGHENLVLAADRDFGEVRYFLVDATAERSAAAGAALGWLARRAGLSLPAPREPAP